MVVHSILLSNIKINNHSQIRLLYVYIINDNNTNSNSKLISYHTISCNHFILQYQSIKIIDYNYLNSHTVWLHYVITRSKVVPNVGILYLYIQ